MTAAHIETLRRWIASPATFVREHFHEEPDAWQADALEAYRAAPRLAMRACKGPGKTCVLAWIAWNFLLTRPHAIIGATSISGDNLKANLWAELARWYGRSELLQSQFEMTRTEIFHREHRNTWKIEARTWARDADAAQIGNALAGLHAKYVMWLADESGEYPDAIMPTMEGIFAGEPVEAHIIQAGNPFLLSGPLYRACTTARRLWRLIEITGDPDDPKRSPRISIEHAREQIEQYGRENPWVLVNIFGQFPPSSLTTLIGPDECAAAQRRVYREEQIVHAPKILGVDVARFGLDASVIFPRQGLLALSPQTLRNVDGQQGAGMVARKWQDWGADAVFVDDSGGYGAAWIDFLRHLGRAPIPVSFAGKPSDQRYYNKRAEMYFDLVQWIKDGGGLPANCPELVSALCAMTYMFKGDRMLLEDKDQVKQRLGYSPDHADALALTFAQPVHRQATHRGAAVAQVEYDPQARWHRDPTQREAAYDPAARWR